MFSEGAQLAVELLCLTPRAWPVQSIAYCTSLKVLRAAVT